MRASTSTTRAGASRGRPLRLLAVAAVALLHLGCSREEAAQPAAQSPSHVGAETCGACHAAEHRRWLGSHHDLAMQEPTAANVLGDFDDASYTYAGVESRFHTRDGRFFVTTDGPDGALTDYPIAYAFGVEPLQQYLIRFPDGRLQALGIAWDSRAAAEGGQRWFHLYPGEDVDFRDALHWTGPAHNWNFMCAECHSTNVAKNYSLSEDRFATTWSEIDVACEACHGPGSAHVAWAERDAADRDAESARILSFPDDGAWTLDADTGIAVPRPERQTALEIDTCARCHSRRAPLSEDYVHGGALLDTHRPELLVEGLYFSDGQILDEVYVYGSFLQSRMFAAGVTCTDCHDAHSLDLKAPGDDVCARCHSPAVFDRREHHRHEQGSAGARCVSCHMPSRDYMVVDGRRDHSFRIPRPDVAARIRAPGACTQCHDDRGPTWAAGVLSEWLDEAPPPHYGDVVHAGRHGAVGAAADLAALAADVTSPAVVRATAVALLADNPGATAARALREAGGDEEPLVRLAAAEAATSLDAEARLEVVAPLLDDAARAVRLAAAAALADAPRASLRQDDAERLDAALAEYRATQALNADRAESHVNLGALSNADGDASGALRAFGKAIELNPKFGPAYVAMADVYRAAGREADVETILRRGLAALPDAPYLHHALGLSQVRRRNYEDGLASLETAHELSDEDPRYAYVLAIALNTLGDAERALDVLRAAHARRPNERAVLTALTTISRDEGRLDDARDYAQRLLRLAPDDPDVRRLADSLGPR